MQTIIAVLFVAAIIGALAACAGILFIDGAVWAGGWQQSGGIALLLLPIAAGLICALIARHLPGGVFLGLADIVLQAQRGGTHRLRHHLLASAASFIALTGGASVGQYGPVAHLGGALVGVTRLLPPRITIACGVAAAVAAAFNAPFTALIFVHEVVLRSYSLRAFTPVAVSAVVGYSVSIGVFNRPLFLELPPMATHHPLLVLFFIVMGFVFGGLAFLYLRGIFWFSQRCRGVPLFVRLPLAGLAAGALAFSMPEIAGGGKLLLQQAVNGMPFSEGTFLLFAKVAATIVCLGAGFAGGVVSPTLSIGALAGLFFFNAAAVFIPDLSATLPVAVVVLCGMMALTAPVLGAPVAAILFTLELAGNYPVAIAAAITIAVAVQTTAKLGGQSYYDLQLAQRGVDIRLRYDEWRLTTDTIAPLLKPVATNIVALAPTTLLSEAIAQVVQNKRAVIYLLKENGYYGGSLSLVTAIGLVQTQTAPLTLQQAITRHGNGKILLTNSDTLTVAMKKIAAIDETIIPVVDSSHALIGVLRVQDLFQRYRQLVQEQRQEETAIS
ncbi:MAG: chloride channel protein [Proteobacteria bacterium]|nr:chloride channel protein [Pseudomonadota bacterium]